MGLKDYRLWVMGQLDSNVQSPTEELPRRAEVRQLARAVAGQPVREVALQVAFERQTLKPVFFT
jgi:hypothetical protein